MLFGNIYVITVHLVVGVLFILSNFVSSHSSNISLGNGVCNVTWNILNKTATFSITARSTGWIALSLNKDASHDQADVYFAYLYGSKNHIYLRDCTIPKGSHHIMQDINSMGSDLTLMKTKNDEPGKLHIKFHRKINTGDVQDFSLKASFVFMQCATGSFKKKQSIFKFFRENAIEDFEWTLPVHVNLLNEEKPEQPPKGEQNEHSNAHFPPGDTFVNGTENTTDVTRADSHPKDRFYDLQPVLVLLTVSGVLTSIVVIIVYCKCSNTRKINRPNMSVAFYKGNTSWSDCSDEDDERMAFINNNKNI